MKKIVIGIVFLMLLTSISAFATGTRTKVMGMNNMIMVDDGNMGMFPGRTLNYPNLAVGEFRADNNEAEEFYNLGITWQFNDDNPWVLGTYVSNWPRFGSTGYEDFMGNTPVLVSLDNLFDNYYMYETASPAGEGGDFGTGTRTQILYGRTLFGHNFGFSLQVARASWEYDHTDSTAQVPLQKDMSKQDFSQYNIGFGLTESSSGQWDVALHILKGSWTDENDSGLTVTEPSGYFDMALSGRYFMVRNPKVTLVPHFMLMTGKRGVDLHRDSSSFFGAFSTTDVRTTEFSRTGIDLGVGMNYTSGPNMLAVLDIGLAIQSIKEERSGNGYTVLRTGEIKTTSVAFPYLKIGFEGQVFKWMDIRAGGMTTLWTNRNKVESDFSRDEIFNHPDNSLYFGFGFHWGRLHIDTYTDADLVLDGFNFISGSSDARDMNAEVTLLYELF